MATTPAWAEGESPAKELSEAPVKALSPWLLLPTFANNPKLGTSVGALGAYIKKFDAESQVSIFLNLASISTKKKGFGSPNRKCP